MITNKDSRPILITFPSEFAKIEFLQKFRAVASTMTRSIFSAFRGASTRLYLQHDFTLAQYHFHKAVMKLRKDGVINNVLVHDGTQIMIKIAEDDKPTFFADVASVLAEINRRKAPEATDS